MQKKIAYVAIVFALVAGLIAGAFAGASFGRRGSDEPFQPMAAGVMDLIIPTYQTTATPGVIIDNLSAGAVSLQVKAASTTVVDINRAGSMDLKNNVISNIGAAGTDFSATGGLTLADALTLSAGALSLSFADLALTDGDTITPTYTVYALDTSGAVTITLAASANEGQLLILINDDANATIIADTNVRTNSGAALTMAGANDIIVFIYQDAEWNELLSIANS